MRIFCINLEILTLKSHLISLYPSLSLDTAVYVGDSFAMSYGLPPIHTAEDLREAISTHKPYEGIEHPMRRVNVHMGYPLAIPHSATTTGAPPIGGASAIAPAAANTTSNVSAAATSLTKDSVGDTPGSSSSDSSSGNGSGNGSGSSNKKRKTGKALSTTATSATASQSPTELGAFIPDVHHVSIVGSLTLITINIELHC
jgi:hypothetical protein